MHCSSLQLCSDKALRLARAVCTILLCARVVCSVLVCTRVVRTVLVRTRTVRTTSLCIRMALSCCGLVLRALFSCTPYKCVFLTSKCLISGMLL